MFQNFIVLEEDNKLIRYKRIATDVYCNDNKILSFKNDKLHKIRIDNKIHVIRDDGICFSLKKFYDNVGDYISVHDLKESDIILKGISKSELLLIKPDQGYISSKYIFKINNDRIVEVSGCYLDDDGYSLDFERYFTFDPINKVIKISKSIENKKGINLENYTKLNRNETFIWKDNKRYILINNKVIRKEYYLDGKLTCIKFY